MSAVGAPRAPPMDAKGRKTIASFELGLWTMVISTSPTMPSIAPTANPQNKASWTHHAVPIQVVRDCSDSAGRGVLCGLPVASQRANVHTVRHWLRAGTSNPWLPRRAAPTWRWAIGSQKTRACGTGSIWLGLCGTVAVKGPIAFGHRSAEWLNR